MGKRKPWEIEDGLWERMEPLLPVVERRYRYPGRKRLDQRKVMCGILFVLYTGIRWEFLPQELGFGSGMTCWRRLRDWNEAGVWQQLHELLLAELRASDVLDLSQASVDGSHLRALKGGDATGRSPVDRGKTGSKHHVIVDAHGIPLAATVTGGNRNDVTQLLPLIHAVPPIRGKRGRPRRRPARPRHRQLLFLFYGIAPTHAQPLKKYTRRTTAGGRERLRWLEQMRTKVAPVRDDPAVCPPVLPGQTALFTLPRSLPLNIVPRILHRPLAGYEEAVELAAEVAAEHRYSKAWLRQCRQMIRLALAVRDADGRELVAEESLDDLQYYRVAVAEILRRAGLLEDRTAPARTRRGPAAPPRTRPAPLGTRPAPPPPDPTPRACADCHAWIVTVRAPRCRSCASWRQNGDGQHPLGVCQRCGGTGLPLYQGRLCRGCALHLSLNGPAAEAEPFTQLWFGGPFGHKLRVLDGELGYQPLSSHPGRERLAAARRPPKQPASPHLVDPRQELLFTMTRDWTAVADLRDADRPRLAPSAQRVFDELTAQARDQRWEIGPRTETTRIMRTLLSWIGADAPILETDVLNLARTKNYFSARRAIQFLEARDLLIPDTEHRRDVDQVAIGQFLGQLPDTLAAELQVWVKVARGEGRWPHAARSFHSIRRYLNVIEPIIKGWATSVTSLKEITADDIKTAISTRQGNPGRAIHIVLQNVFRALRQERVIFRDPTRGLVFGGITILPQSIPSDRLDGLLDRARGHLVRLGIALVGIHALPGPDIRGLLLDDLDLSAGRLTVRRGSWRHTVWLDSVTHRLAADWLTERHRRWPTTTNPHLLINQQTAMHAHHPRITTSVITDALAAEGLTMQQVRQDRILYEARHKDDPLHLMRLFGISDGTAMRYITAAHPERTSKLPR